MMLPAALNESKLPDGEYLLAALNTPRGLLEARAQAKQGKLGEVDLDLDRVFSAGPLSELHSVEPHP